MMMQASKPIFSIADEIFCKASTFELSGKDFLQNAIRSVINEQEKWTIKQMSERLNHEPEAVCASMRTMFKRGELVRAKEVQSDGSRLVYGAAK